MTKSEAIAISEESKMNNTFVRIVADMIKDAALNNETALLISNRYLMRSETEYFNALGYEIIFYPGYYLFLWQK